LEYNGWSCIDWQSTRARLKSNYPASTTKQSQATGVGIYGAITHGLADLYVGE